MSQTTTRSYTCGWCGNATDPALLIQALFGPVFLLIVLGPAVFDELSRIGITPAIDNVEAYVDLLEHGGRVATAAPAGALRQS